MNTIDVGSQSTTDTTDTWSNITIPASMLSVDMHAGVCANTTGATVSDLLIAFNIGCKFELLNKCHIIKAHPVFYKVLLKVTPRAEDIIETYIIVHDYNVFIILLNYIRYNTILSRDEDLIKVAVSINDLYLIGGFNDAANAKLITLRPQKFAYGYHDPTHKIMVSGGCLSDPITGNVVPHGPWNTRVGQKRIFSVMMHGHCITRYEVPANSTIKYSTELKKVQVIIY
jgi:hypothetical protein